MTKLLISLYILVILLIAGFAHADDISYGRENFKRIFIGVTNVEFNGSQLIITGPTSTECKRNNKIDQHVQFFPQAQEVHVTVSTGDNACISNEDTYTVLVDLNSYFSQKPIQQDVAIQLSIENSNRTFNYIAKSLQHFDFDQHIEGTIAWSRVSQQYVIETNDQKVFPILPTFNISDFANKKVSLKAQIGTQLANANGADHIFVSQLSVMN